MVFTMVFTLVFTLVFTWQLGQARLAGTAGPSQALTWQLGQVALAGWLGVAGKPSQALRQGAVQGHPRLARTQGHPVDCAGAFPVCVGRWRWNVCFGVAVDTCPGNKWKGFHSYLENLVLNLTDSLQQLGIVPSSIAFENQKKVKWKNSPGLSAVLSILNTVDGVRALREAA